MTIRTRLALQFMLLGSLVLGTAFVVIYMLSAAYRAEQFQGRMRDRGTSTAKLLIQVDEVSEALLRKIESNSPVRLPEEAIRIFDYQDELIFHIGDENLPPTPVQLLDRIRLEGDMEQTYEQREGILFRSMTATSASWCRSPAMTYSGGASSVTCSGCSCSPFSPGC